MNAGLGPANVADLPPTVLENLLLYHTLAGAVARDAIAREETLFTALELNDEQVSLATSGATLIDSEGNAVNILDADVECANGYLHYVDAVLMPPDLMWSLEAYNAEGGTYEGVFDTFLEAMRITNTSDSCKGIAGPFTVRGCFFVFVFYFGTVSAAGFLILVARWLLFCVFRAPVGGCANLGGRGLTLEYLGSGRCTWCVGVKDHVTHFRVWCTEQKRTSNVSSVAYVPVVTQLGTSVVDVAADPSHAYSLRSMRAADGSITATTRFVVDIIPA